MSVHITDNLGMLQNISSLKYFHGSNGELKQMEFQRDLSTQQTLLTQIIVQQSWSWIHITFWEKRQGSGENGCAAQRQLGRLALGGLARQSYSPCQCLHAKVGAWCWERASALCHKLLEKELGNGRSNSWESSLGNQGERETKPVKREKQTSWKAPFPQAQASHE